MRTREGMPISWMARRSNSRISDAVTSFMSQPESEIYGLR
jgi:hypothetical protein